LTTYLDHSARSDSLRKLHRKHRRPSHPTPTISKIYGDLARLTAEEKIAARAAMREKFGRMVEKVVLGPSGIVCHYRDGRRAFGSWTAAVPTPPREQT